MSAKLEWEIQLCAIYSRIAVILLQIVFNAVIPDHDASVFNPPPAPRNKTAVDAVVEFLLGGFRRWDGVYFIHIAEYGYTYENTVAFFPLFPLFVGKVTEAVSLFTNSFLLMRNVALVLSVVLNFVLFVKTAKILYHLGVFVLVDKKLAYKSAMLFCINPASIFFTAAYSETMFAFILFYGMLYASRGNHLIASVFFGLASAARSNGIVAIGFIVYGTGKLFLQTLYFTYLCKLPLISKILQTFMTAIKYVMLTVLYLSSSLLPFALYQYYIYDIFCGGQPQYLPLHIVEYGHSENYTMATSKRSEWCNHYLPLSYSYIQSKHWDVGFLHYYKIKQIPNFILAAPVICISMSACLHYYRQNKKLCHRLGILFVVDHKKNDNHEECTGFASSRIFPFVVHLLTLTVFGCFFIHIQVLTRLLCSSSPVIYWYTAHCIRKSKDSKTQHPRHEERKFAASNLNPHHKTNVLFDDLLSWRNLDFNSKLIYTYFLSYFVIGTAAFSNFLPWT